MALDTVGFENQRNWESSSHRLAEWMLAIATPGKPHHFALLWLHVSRGRGERCVLSGHTRGRVENLNGECLTQKRKCPVG